MDTVVVLVLLAIGAIVGLALVFQGESAVVVPPPGAVATPSAAAEAPPSDPLKLVKELTATFEFSRKVRDHSNETLATAGKLPAVEAMLDGLQPRLVAHREAVEQANSLLDQKAGELGSKLTAQLTQLGEAASRVAPGLELPAQLEEATRKAAAERQLLEQLVAEVTGGESLRRIAAAFQAAKGPAAKLAVLGGLLDDLVAAAPLVAVPVATPAAPPAAPPAAVLVAAPAATPAP